MNGGQQQQRSRLPPSLLPATVLSSICAQQPRSATAVITTVVAAAPQRSASGSFSMVTPSSTADNEVAPRFLIRVTNLDMAFSERQWRRLLDDALRLDAGLNQLVSLFLFCRSLLTVVDEMVSYCFSPII